MSRGKTGYNVLAVHKYVLPKIELTCKITDSISSADNLYPPTFIMSAFVPGHLTAEN